MVNDSFQNPACDECKHTVVKCLGVLKQKMGEVGYKVFRIHDYNLM